MPKIQDDRSPVNAAQFAQLLDELNLTPAALASRFGTTPSSVYAWQAGTNVIPLWVAEHLRLCLDIRNLALELPFAYSVAATSEEPFDSNPSIKVDKYKDSVHLRQNNLHNESMRVFDSNDLQAALAALGLKQSEFSRLMGVATNTVNRWATGSGPIPGWVGVHLALLLEIQAMHTRFVQPIS